MLTKADGLNLFLYANGGSLSRNVRRRLEREKLIEGGRLTEDGLQTIVDWAPRSRWTPPDPLERYNAEAQQRPSRHVGNLLVISALSLAASFRE